MMVLEASKLEARRRRRRSGGGRGRCGALRRKVMQGKKRLGQCAFASRRRTRAGSGVPLRPCTTAASAAR